jgi:LPPG:FO 2-phospho-L-lactate transferase
MIVVLTGGTGGAKLIAGLAAEIDPAGLTIITNTGDDCVFHGLNISPDVDTIIYTLAGLVDSTRGWGIQGDTFSVLNQLRCLGEDAWFQLGDRDLATHITRTRLLREGVKLAEVTDRIRRSLGVKATILPMSDDRVQTRVDTPQGEISFQEFFVKEASRREVIGVRFDGVDRSEPAPGVIEAIERANAIIVCPSNPITSIGPILAVPGIRAVLKEVKAPVVGVSPIIGQVAISGPAHKLMIACGKEASVVGVAACYDDFLDTLLIAHEDRGWMSQIGRLHVQVVLADIHMTSLVEKRRLAREVLAWARK